MFNENQSGTSLIKLDITKLRALVMNSKSKQIKLWEMIVARLIILMPNKFPIISKWSYDYLKRLTKLSAVKFYAKGDPVDMSTGAIILSGKIQLVSPN